MSLKTPNSRSSKLRIDFVRSAIARRMAKHIPGHYVVSKYAVSFHACTLIKKKLKGRTESHFILVLEINNHQTRFNSGLRRIHPNDCKFEFN